MAEEEETPPVLGATLYHKGMEEDEVSEIFDDAALIAAYEESVSLAYEAASKPRPSKAKPKDKKKAAREPGAPRAAVREWKAGDECLAPFSQDGDFYPGTIVRVEGDRALVHFTDYEEDEREMKHVSELLPYPPPPPRSEQERVGRRRSETAAADEETLAAGTSEASAPPPIHCPPQTTVPRLPPPPTPACLAGGRGGRPSGDEALSNTLLSWYMSGYHTGYYQAMKDLKIE